MNQQSSNTTQERVEGASGYRYSFDRGGQTVRPEGSSLSFRVSTPTAVIPDGSRTDS
jgi:hypothetical protein